MSYIIYYLRVRGAGTILLGRSKRITQLYGKLRRAHVTYIIIIMCTVAINTCIYCLNNNEQPPVFCARSGACIYYAQRSVSKYGLRTGGLRVAPGLLKTS